MTTDGKPPEAEASAGQDREIPLTSAEINAIRAEATHYEEAKAVAVDAMKMVQKRRGWLDDDALGAVAALLGMSATELEGLATFYNLVYRRPVGRHVIHVCDSVSCWVCGYAGLRDRLKRELGVDFGETTADQRFTLLPTVCLGACDRAPTMLVDEELHGNVTDANLNQILERYE